MHKQIVRNIEAFNSLFKHFDDKYGEELTTPEEYPAIFVDYIYYDDYPGDFAVNYEWIYMKDFE